jgi:hypothetical protein
MTIGEDSRETGEILNGNWKKGDPYVVLVSLAALPLAVVWQVEKVPMNWMT